jgi:hypothetical protein
MKKLLKIYCAENREDFVRDYSWFFEGKSYLDWCNECLRQNGLPSISFDAGPFCNLLTSDFGKECTDSSQCEGYCIAENENSNSGKCSEYDMLEDGCGWLEVVNGEVAELCVS